MKNVASGKEKQLAYTVEYRQFNKALKEEFYLEAVAIGYAIIEDRLIAFLHYAGIVTRTKEDLKINKEVYPYMRRLLSKDDNYKIQVKDISVKIAIIEKLMKMTQEEAQAIDESVNAYVSTLNRKKSIAKCGYMNSLFLQLNNLNRQEILNIIADIEPWRVKRNQLIHALLNKNAVLAQEEKKSCAETGYNITRQIDHNLVKPFKTDNRLRKKYNIQ